MLARVTETLDRLEKKIDKVISRRKKPGTKEPKREESRFSRETPIQVTSAAAPPNCDPQDQSTYDAKVALLRDPMSRHAVRCDRISRSQLAALDSDPKAAHALATAKLLDDGICKSTFC